MNVFARVGLGVLATLQLCGATEPPKPTHVVPMDYPRRAHLAEVQGVVELQAQISPDGEVLTIVPRSGHPLLVPAVRESLKQWQFTRCSGDDRACAVVIKFVFVIKGQCPDKCEPEFAVNGPYQVTVRAKGLSWLYNLD